MATPNDLPTVVRKLSSLMVCLVGMISERMKKIERGKYEKKWLGGGREKLLRPECFLPSPPQFKLRGEIVAIKLLNYPLLSYERNVVAILLFFLFYFGV